MPLFLSGAFLTSLCLSLVGTYAVRGWALRRGYVDVPDSVRRLHSQPTPNVGGIAVVFAREGAKVVIAELKEHRAQRVADEIRAAGGDAIALRTDVSQEGQVRHMVDETVRRFGTVEPTEKLLREDRRR